MAIVLIFYNLLIMSRLYKRSDIDICDRNCVVLSLGEAVRRWTSDGQFLMTEVNGSDSYQSNLPDIDISSYSERIGKIEAALAGMEFVKEVKAPAAFQQPSNQPSAEPVSQPSNE